MTAGDRWVRRARPDPRARLRLFCLPYAGGGTRVFHGWADELPRGVEVCLLCPPGRERRIAEAPFREHRPLVSAAAEGLRPWLDRPYAVFGYSMGAFLGFELARRFRDEGLPEPVHLYAGAHRGPHIPYPKGPMSDLPDDRFLEELRRHDGTPAAVFDAPELLALLLPLLRADFRVCERYDFQPAAPLACPVTVYGGVDDPDIPRDHLEAWAAHTTGRFRVAIQPGGHFFIDQQRAALLADLSAELRRDLDALGG